MPNNTPFLHLLPIIGLALVVNYALVVLIRTIYRYRMIDKYCYDYYDLKKKSRLAKSTINLHQTLRKIDNLYIAGFLLVLESICYYFVL